MNWCDANTVQRVTRHDRVVRRLLRHTLEDYDSWKTGFDAHADTRREFGSTENYHLFRSAGNPNDIAMLMEWDRAESFQRFMEVSDLKQRMSELGVIGEPEVEVFEVIEAPVSEPAAA